MSFSLSCIGGGVIGCSTLYQLCKKGIKAILLEQAKITSGTTWHTAGLFWRLRPNDVEVQLLRGTKNVLDSLEEETGMNPGFIQNGGLFIARTEVSRCKELACFWAQYICFGPDNGHSATGPKSLEKMC